MRVFELSLMPPVAVQPPSVDETARRRFEHAWRDGRPERIEDCLPTEDDQRYLGTLTELVQIEIELSWKKLGKSGSNAFAGSGGATAATNGAPVVEAYLRS